MSKIYDVIILGAGPAGLAAGLYAGRSRLSTLIIEKGQDGGQIAITDEIENYPGQIVDGESGPSLIARMTEQAEKFGAERISDTITEVQLDGEVKVLKSAKAEYQAKNIIIATGAYSRPIGLVGAAEFMPIAEDSGQIRAIGYYALDHAGRCISELMITGREFDSICIPVSPVLLVQEDFLDQVTKVLETYQIPKGKLALEVDDSALSNVYLNVNITMQELSDMGVELVLNNFGSGCAPVSSILDLPINTVKLERMFVWQLETNPKSASIAGGLIQIARELGIHIIAEGVETENQLNALNNYQCEYQQGFYYAPTMEQDVLIKVMGTTLDESRVTIEEEKLKMKM